MIFFSIFSLSSIETKNKKQQQPHTPTLLKLHVNDPNTYTLLFCFFTNPFMLQALLHSYIYLFNAPWYSELNGKSNGLGLWLNSICIAFISSQLPVKQWRMNPSSFPRETIEEVVHSVMMFECSSTTRQHAALTMWLQDWMTTRVLNCVHSYLPRGDIWNGGQRAGGSVTGLLLCSDAVHR